MPVSRSARALLTGVLLVASLAGCSPGPVAPKASIGAGGVAAVTQSVAAAELGSRLDASEAAKQAYLLWFAYELQTTADRRPDDELWMFGLASCVNIERGYSLESIEDGMETKFGLTGSGAQAVIRSSLEALCPALDYGYKTYFDRKVDRFRYPALEDPRLTWSTAPPEWDFGNFMRGACQRYTAAGMANIELYLFEQRASYALIAGVDQPYTIRLLLSHAMWPGCGQLYQA